MHPLYLGCGDSASELLVSMSSGTSLEDFYPSIAINSLMRILKDHSLSQHHTMAIQALGFIFKSLGIKSVPYLPQVRMRVVFSSWCMQPYGGKFWRGRKYLWLKPRRLLKSVCVDLE